MVCIVNRFIDYYYNGSGCDTNKNKNKKDIYQYMLVCDNTQYHNNIYHKHTNNNNTNNIIDNICIYIKNISNNNTNKYIYIY